MIHNKLTINCKGKLIGLHQPIVMGVLNTTPDSFYDGGQYQQENAMLRQAEKMLTEGASIIDVGGMSSRPGAEIISEQEELQRVIPAIEHLVKHFPDVVISVDTLRSVVARRAMEVGASMVNDISAGSIDTEMYATVADLGVPYVLMHMKGIPKNMQQNIDYQDVVQEVLDFMIQEVGKLRTLGVKDILLDIGFGFGKTVEQNYELLKKMHIFKMLDLPILAGISRKSMIYKVLQTFPQEALNGTSALHMVALQQGAKILRVHDVQEAIQVIRLWEQLERVGGN